MQSKENLTCSSHFKDLPPGYSPWQKNLKNDPIYKSLSDELSKEIRNYAQM